MAGVKCDDKRIEERYSDEQHRQEKNAAEGNESGLEKRHCRPSLEARTSPCLLDTQNE
jgi:hypothetical protein